MTNKATCKKCLETKQHSEFKRNWRVEGGIYPVCKACESKRRKAFYMANRERLAADAKEYRKTPAGKAAHKKAVYNYADKVDRAGTKVGSAIRRGDLIKPDECSVCGSKPPSGEIHAHHDDYSKPLDVRWVCRACHMAIHNKSFVESNTEKEK